MRRTRSASLRQRDGAILHRAAFIPIIFLALGAFSCSSVAPVSISRYDTPEPVAVPAPALSLPDGWADITSASPLPQVELLLVNSDTTGSMVLREIQDADSMLLAECRKDPCLGANISLLSKFNGESKQRRVTRTPEIIDTARTMCGYVYTERGLLRKVIVFLSNGRLYELELYQERSETPIEAMSAAQRAVAAAYRSLHGP